MQYINVDIDAKENKEVLIGLFSDLHADEKDADFKKAKKDMSSIVDRGGRLWFNGDTGGFILPTDKKRFKVSNSMWDSDTHINDIVAYFVENLRPYADYIDFFGKGNHEESCIMFNNVDPIQFIVYELNRIRSKSLQPILMSQYKGFVNVRMKYGKKTTLSYCVYHDHGRGGGAPVTKGMIDFNRVRNIFANLYWFGHKHTCITDHTNSWIYPDDRGNIKIEPCEGIITPGYKDIIQQYDCNETVTRNGVQMTRGHKINWSESTFSGQPANGYGELLLQLKTKPEGSGYYIGTKLTAVRS